MPINSFEDYYMSWVPQKPKDHTPLYKSFAQQLEDSILTFSLAPNTLLPPQRELADYLDVNLSTITKAYKICEQKGYIYAVTGKGTFVSPNALLYKNRGFISGNEINLKTVEPFHETDQLIEAAIKRIMERPNLKQLLTYQTSQLQDYHKLMAVEYLNYLKVPASKEHLLISTGSQNALVIAMLSLFHAGDHIAVDAFTYHHFKILANFLSVQLYSVANDELGMDPEQLEFICKRYHIHGIYLMPSCSNPTAIEMPLTRRMELTRIIAKYQLTLLEDDSYRFLADTACPSFYELLPEQTIYINSTTKSFTSGVRIAYLLYPSSLQNKIIHGEHAANLHYTSFDAEIISELIRSNDYLCIERSTKDKAAFCNTMYNSIVGSSNDHTNPYSFYRWFDTGSDNHTLIHTLAQNNISVMESQLFNAGTESADRYIRITLSSEKNHEVLENALRTLCSLSKQNY